MEFKFFIDVDQKVIIESFFGDISFSIMEKAIPYIFNHPNYDKQYDGIIDFRKANLRYSKEELRHFIQTISTNEKGMRGRAAVLVSEPMSAAMATLYGEEMKSIHAVGIFCSESEVLHYLHNKPEIFKRIEQEDAISLK